MAGKRVRRTKGHRRMGKGKKRAVRVSHRAATAAFRPKPLTRYPALRTFQLYPQVLKSDKTVDETWLSKLYRYGCMALHLFTLAIAAPRNRGPYAAWKFAVTGAVQGFIIGIDDLILDSPLCELDKNDKDYFSCFDYCQGRCSSVTITITPGSETSRRAGRYVISVVLLSYDQAQRYLYSVQDHRVIKASEVIEFDTLLQYPGAVSCAADKPTQLKIRMSGHAAQWHEIGQVSEPSDTSTFPGGIPLIKVIFGYRDVSSSSPNATLLYSADESLIQMDVCAEMTFREPGRRYIRTTPLKTCSDSTVTIIKDHMKKEIPLDLVTLDENGLLNIPDDEIEDPDGFEIIPRLRNISLATVNRAS